MENPIKMDDLGVPFFLETPICAPPPNKHWPLGGFHGNGGGEKLVATERCWEGERAPICMY